MKKVKCLGDIDSPIERTIGFARRVLIGLIILFVLSFIGSICLGATNGTYHTTKVDGWDVVKITYASAPAATDVITFPITGMAMRIVIIGAATDDNGTIKIVDSSGAEYFNGGATPFASDYTLDYVITGTDISSNTYGGIPVYGSSTLTLTNATSLAATTIYIYYKTN